MALKTDEELAFYHAVVGGDAAQAEALLETHPELIGWQDCDLLDKPDTTALHLNTRHMAGGQCEKARAVFDVLMRFGADVNIRERSGWTPLLFACLNGELGMAKELLRRGADPFAVTGEGCNALMCAAWKGHIDCVRLMLDLGLPINAQDKQGRTALFHAGLYDVTRTADVSRVMIRYLIEQGADHLIKNGEGKTAADGTYPPELREYYAKAAEDVETCKIREAALRKNGLPDKLAVYKPLTFRR